MKLLSVDASPFVRKVRILIIELGLEERVEIVDLGGVSPVASNPRLNAVNPLGLIPALELDDGGCLFDSPVVCEYLNHLAHGPFFPTDPGARFRTLGLQALADGMLELSVALRYEATFRPEELRWPQWSESQQEKVDRGLDALEAQCGEFAAAPTIGEISAACVLGYRDFRFPDLDWRAGRPALAAWFEGMMQRESLRRTLPA